MKVEDCRDAVAIADALTDLIDVRKAFKDDASLVLSVVALDGDRDGGTHKATLHVPGHLANAALDPIEKHLRAELKAFGVTIG